MMNGSERRSEERSDCAIAAKIELSDRLAIAVTLRDLSTSGVRLQVAESIDLPDEFDLLVPVVSDVEQRYRVKLAWRRGDMVGGELREPASHKSAAVEAMDVAIQGDRAKSRT